MPLHDFVCALCEKVSEHMVMGDGSTVIPCDCGGTMHRVFLKAPMGRVGGKSSSRSIASMKKSFNERFVKKEIDDVRHKHGKVFDDSLRSAAAQRIKKDLK